MRCASLASLMLVVVTGCALPAPAAAMRVTTYPGPGWDYASPTSRITFAGALPGELRGLTVTGSRSGRHDGVLHPLRGGRGSVFAPARPFAPAEQVTVEVGHRVRGAGGRSWYSFRIADPVQGSWKSPTAPPLLTRERGTSSGLRRARLHTIVGDAPVGISMRRGSAYRARSRRLLVSPRPPTGDRDSSPSLMILANDGRVLWYRAKSGVVHDLNAATYRGRPVLTYFLRASSGPDRHELLDEHYDVIARVIPGNGYGANAHELQLTRSGTAYIGMYTPVRLRGSGLKVTDFVIQEIDVPTGDVLFEWHALDHVPVFASYIPQPSSGWARDYFHGNSIEPPQPGGHTLTVSARKTSAIYGIDRRNGHVRWILGGKQDQFGLVSRHPGWQFCGQHDARRLHNGDLTLFDNGGTGLPGTCPPHRARVMRFRIHTGTKRVRLVRTIWSDSSSDDGAGYRPSAVGSARFQPDGDVLVSWGNTGRITEISPGGLVRFRLQLQQWSYRAVRAAWTGDPHGRPAVAARRAGGAVDVWASWNGATEIHRWRVLAGPAAGSLAPTGCSVRFAGLETRMRLRTAAAVVAVQALDRAGRVLGTSRAVTPR